MNYELEAQPGLPWPEVKQQAFVGWYWCDPDGAHIADDPPEDVPAATHLWAWGPSSWGRWRIDPLGAGAGGATLTGARLALMGDGAPSKADEEAAVEVTVAAATTWPADAPVGLVDSLRARPLNLICVTRPVKLTFLAFDDPAL
ncbi:hypothetical protein SAMN02745244_02583 [Tessaracoccus bendigoensis DSM 12906]|uniref:Uncharacterized protein n=1 Tax=Tessaracoccus bendigoensis DSM 12906 TaxID=1123357 RepID=A0A1M6JK68_9ACTN|nr:hypothetical protein [Tessaracoccus bendigoensis]SHJ47063.1 hypothetical protein SAMN02745244_02583 [Tessaracoccus bendigoensis DSM 12906]